MIHKNYRLNSQSFLKFIEDVLVDTIFGVFDVRAGFEENIVNLAYFEFRDFGKKFFIIEFALESEGTVNHVFVSH